MPPRGPVASSHAATVVVVQFPHPDDTGDLLESFAEQLAVAYYTCRAPMIAFTTPPLAAMAKHFQSPPGAPRILRSVSTAYSIRTHHEALSSWDWWAEHASHAGAKHLPAEPESNVLAAWNAKSAVARQAAADNPFQSRSIWYMDCGSFDRYDNSHLSLLARRYEELTVAFGCPDALIIFSVAEFTGPKCVRAAV